MMVLANGAKEDRTYEVAMPIDAYEARRIEILDWLIDNFGDDDITGLWEQWELASENTIYFTFHYERDAMAFKLAWI